MIQQINTASPSFDYSMSRAHMNASFPEKKPKQDDMKPRSTSKPRKTSTSNEKIGKKKNTFNPSRPCYCFRELVHWTQTCLVKIRENNAMFQFKKCAADVAGFNSTLSIEYIKEFLNSGASHSLVGDISLLTSLSPTNMNLSIT
ncbi:hypothetical protein O181_005935 [Austropuccinia psidii MF-1]|uniref:Uncharacterized protein n=1 Tax=Austropuccinia psidii MF-1 TaxID=1389203 RepID=A0A9Q3BJC9_9BASI|nr:hypothetical protein [Austropuccinia psidii MF-1]